MKEMRVESRLLGITVVGKRRKKPLIGHRAEKDDYRAREIGAAVKLRPEKSAPRHVSGRADCCARPTMST